ncbi:MAG: DUF1934 domain-containing protein [Clostridia bacterium]|nr:DUF1934 domain-containing protein [Clostridia bacterium]
MERMYDVNINMLSVISTTDERGQRDGDADRTEASYKGRLRITEDGTVLSFRERTEGGDMVSEIVVTDREVRVSRRGAISSDMKFIEGRAERSVYKIPPHAFDMEIFCKRAKIQNLGREGRVDLLYSMTLGGESRSARMRITWN